MWASQVRKRSVQVLAKVCASFSKRAVLDTLRDVKSLSRSELEQLVDELRASQPMAEPAKRSRRTADGSPAARIRRVLGVEAGLPANEAIAQLRAELTKTVNGPLPSAAGSLEDWLEAVLDLVPAGEVLNAAMTIAKRVKA